MLEVTEPFFRDIVIYAFRYSLLRKSMAGSIYTDWLIDNLDIVSDHDVSLMIREIKEAKELGTLTDIDLLTWSSFSTTLQQLRDL